MAEEFGDGAQRCALHDQPGRERVPEVVPGEVLALSDLESRVEGVLEHRAQASGIEHDEVIGTPVRALTGRTDAAYYFVRYGGRPRPPK
jgi:hypothetical protein